MQVTASGGQLGGSTGAAVCVDCAEHVIDAARVPARDVGVGNAHFFVADAQNDDLRGPCDCVLARFGPCLSSWPGAAMRNVRRVMRRGGRFMPQVVEALRDALARFVRADGVWTPSSAWFITATKPA
jgi:ubiquinone/menaquinone biosynthesis C-methylase UbiE